MTDSLVVSTTTPRSDSLPRSRELEFHQLLDQLPAAACTCEVDEAPGNFGAARRD
jgi:hypothetical protein